MSRQEPAIQSHCGSQYGKSWVFLLVVQPRESGESDIGLKKIHDAR